MFGHAEGYNKVSMDSAIKKVEGFKADYGGTSMH